MDFKLSRNKSSGTPQGKLLQSLGKNKDSSKVAENQTIRIAVLGGKGTGKSSFISRLTVNLIPEVHYPTRKQNNWLFKFVPEKSDFSRCVLDEHWHERMASDIHNVAMVDGCIYPSPVLSQHLQLSKNLFQNAVNDFIKFKQTFSINQSVPGNGAVDIPETLYSELKDLKDKQENEYYKYITDSDENNIHERSHNLYNYYENSDGIKGGRDSLGSNNVADNYASEASKLTKKELLELKRTSIHPISSIDNTERDEFGTTNSRDDSNPLTLVNSLGNPTFYIAGHDTHTILKTIKENHQIVLPVIYNPPSISPLLIDIIDTPPFDPEMVVPFLEVSLFRNIGSNYLHKLANDKRRPVSTRSMLTASGATELNGNVDCYILMYSCYPNNIEPPQYDDLNPGHSGDSSKPQSPDQSADVNDDQIMLLENIRETIEEAWEEYYNYKENWENGQEGDVYSLMYNLKKIWSTNNSHNKNNNRANSEGKNNQKFVKAKRFKTFDDPLAPPPFIIVATHTACELTSPVLLQRGKDLATEWGCSFVAVDNYVDYNVEEALCVAVREVAERKKLHNYK